MKGNAGVWAAVFLLLVSGVLLQQSLQLDYANSLGPGPGFLPRWLSGILIVVTLAYLWDSIRHETVRVADLLPVGNARVDMALMLTGLVLFALFVETVGFVLAGSQLIFLMTVRKFHWLRALLTAVAVSVALLFVFQRFLGVALPVNDFGW